MFYLSLLFCLIICNQQKDIGLFHNFLGCSCSLKFVFCLNIIGIAVIAVWSSKIELSYVIENDGSCLFDEQSLSFQLNFNGWLQYGVELCVCKYPKLTVELYLFCSITLAVS